MADPPQPDPQSTGLVRWTIWRARSNLKSVGLGVISAIVIPALTIAAAAPSPSARGVPPPFSGRLIGAGAGAILGVAIIVLVAAGYALFRAPYEQRNALRLVVTELRIFAVADTANISRRLALVHKEHVTICGRHSADLAAICCALETPLQIWTRDSEISRELALKFPCPEAQNPFEKYRQQDRVAQSALRALVANGMVEEGRRPQSETKSGPSGLVISSSDPSKETHTVDTSFSEYRWTDEGRRIARRLMEEAIP